MAGEQGRLLSLTYGDSATVRPKVAIGRLLFLAGYAAHGVAWQVADVPVAQEAGLVPAMAQIL